MAGGKGYSSEEGIDGRLSRKKRRRRANSESSEESMSSSASETSSEDRKKSKKRKRSKRKKEKKKKDKQKKRSSKSKSKKSKRGRDVLVTDEERKARKEAKKAAKIAAMFGYTNTENPFGDSNLTEQFVWDKKKKRDKEKKQEGSRRPTKNEQHRERLKEISLARERRKQRELEQEAYEKQKEEEARLREMETFENWEEKEEEFHLKQQRERSKIRIKQGRELPIDIVAKNLLLYQEYEDRKKAAENGYFPDDSTVLGDNIPMEVDEPYKILKNLNSAELKQIRKDILENKLLEESNKDSSENVEFWDALLRICDAEIEKAAAKAGSRYESGGIHEKVNKDIKRMLKGKSKKELETLFSDVQQTLQDPNIDVDYWEAVSKGVQVAICKAVVDAKHSSILKLRLSMLQRKEKEKSRKIKTEDGVSNTTKKKVDDLQKLKEPVLYKSLESLLESSGKSTRVIPYQEDLTSRNTQRKDILKRQAVLHQEAETELSSRGNSGMNIDEIIQNQHLAEGEEVMPERDSIKLPTEIYSWKTRFKPRKPRYFNRVKTGFDWNKYNQTHYDEDNPPPKIVKGYKFNIFYPDLIDKSKVPYFKLEAADEEEFVIIRFIAGAPYEDVAFKIVNKEWAKQAFNGFRSTFERGILHLHFNFKRTFYRK